MRISLCDDDGVLLDEVEVTVQEWREEVRRHPFSLLAHMQPGNLDQIDR